MKMINGITESTCRNCQYLPHFRGRIIDNLDDGHARIMHQTNWCATYGEAYRKAEQLMKRNGRTSDRYEIDIIE